MAIKLKKTALDPEAILFELVKAHGRDVVSGVAAMTDSSGGTADTSTWAFSLAATNLANAANNSTNLAQKAASEAALGTVKDALAELYTKVNEYATKLGIDNVTYNGGGTAADGTIAAVTVAVTAAATGGQATNINTNLAAINTAFYVLAAKANEVARALGLTELALPTGYTIATTVASLATDVGTAADPGVTKAALDTELAKYRNAVATIAAKVNTFNDGLGNALVVFN